MIRLSHPSNSICGNIKLPSSKSISNRMLILSKLYEPDLRIENLSTANDTVVLNRILHQEDNHFDVEDAGTAFRFLVAYCSVTPGTFTITGTERLHQRPIKGLVDVLTSLGAKITYLKEEGFAPLQIAGGNLQVNQSQIDVTDVASSQFISALLMISPLIKGDFEFRLDPKMNSFTYLLLTISAMRRMGFSVYINGSVIKVDKHRKFSGEFFKVEPDWSSFYYWYAIAQVADKVDLAFEGLKQSNMQKDRRLLFTFGNPALLFSELPEGLLLTKAKSSKFEFPSAINLSQFPDLAPTFAILVAIAKKQMLFKGLDSLPLKESDRIAAMQEQLALVGCTLTEQEDGWFLDAANFRLEPNTIFPTFKDHRMAMCLAPLALQNAIVIEDEAVVRKSYPEFWEHLKAAGFEIEYL